MQTYGRPSAAVGLRERGAMTGSTVDGSRSGFPCADDPDRWTTSPDDGAKALCRACPRRWLCAQEACRTPGAEGLWAGVLIPGEGRGRRFALKQLGSLADRHGFPVRTAH
jgi:WhiB family redox-sensing transcriptional regulator